MADETETQQKPLWLDWIESGGKIDLRISSAMQLLRWEARMLIEDNLDGEKLAELLDHIEYHAREARLGYLVKQNARPL